ncbi:putative phosphoinositide phosphatase SAC9 [Diplonema papillatum]|nr:putative phosphoinositide phosphatase SAC9 [Diplonema papillatum]
MAVHGGVPRGRSQHLVLKDGFGRYYIVSSLASRNDTQVIAIEGVTGRFHYSATPGVDMFPTAEDAIESFSRSEIVCEAWALAGYIIVGNEGWLLTVCSAEETFVVPPNRSILTVEKSHWVRIPLQYGYGVL